MAEMPESTREGSGRNSQEYGGGASNGTAGKENSHPKAERLMEEVVERMFSFLDKHLAKQAIS